MLIGGKICLKILLEVRAEQDLAGRCAVTIGNLIYCMTSILENCIPSKVLEGLDVRNRR
jgi:hypothetical protein